MESLIQNPSFSIKMVESHPNLNWGPHAYLLEKVSDFNIRLYYRNDDWNWSSELRKFAEKRLRNKMRILHDFERSPSPNPELVQDLSCKFGFTIEKGPIIIDI